MAGTARFGKPGRQPHASKYQANFFLFKYHQAVAQARTSLDVPQESASHGCTHPPRGRKSAPAKSSRTKLSNQVRPAANPAPFAAGADRISRGPGNVNRLLARITHNLRAPWLDLCSIRSFPSPAIRPVLAAVSEALLKQIFVPSSHDLVRNTRWSNAVTIRGRKEPPQLRFSRLSAAG